MSAIRQLKKKGLQTDLYFPTEFSVVIFPNIVPPVNGSFSTSIIYILKVSSSALTLIKIFVSSVIL